MCGSNEPLSGFSWRPGTIRETIGIDIWSDVFLHTMDKTGEKIAIFLMDTQGLFDKESTPTDNTRIFALGTLISSIQVLNLKTQIQEDQLQYVHFATEFAQFNGKKKSKMNGKPFQNLTFLIRDWENEEEFEFGAEGGRKYLKSVLTPYDTQQPELRTVREFITNTFEEVGCCFLPHPGSKIIGRKAYDGRWSEMQDNFKDELKKSIEYLLMPERLILKKLNSQTLTCKEMYDCIEKYLNLFKSGEIPKTLTIYDSMAESNLNSLIKKCIDHYSSGTIRDPDLKNEESIRLVHNKWKTKTLKIFDDENKMGDELQQQTFRAKLDKQLEHVYDNFKNINQQRFKEFKEAEDIHRAKLEEERKKKEKAEEEKKRSEEEARKERKRAEEDSRRKEAEWREEVRRAEQEKREMEAKVEEMERNTILRKFKRGAGFVALTATVPFSAAGAGLGKAVVGMTSGKKEGDKVWDGFVNDYQKFYDNVDKW